MIHMDFETYSEVSLKVVGAFRYAQDPSTEILILCYAFDEGRVNVWLPGMDPPEELFRRIRKGETIGAWNAQFEYVIWNFVMRRMCKGAPMVQASQLNCTAARAAMCSLPRALGKCATALGTMVVKDKAGGGGKEGGKLIKLFCQPRKPTKRDLRTRIRPEDDKAAFQRFIRYCQTDVSTEREIDEELPQLPPFEREMFRLDYVVNTRGIPLDLQMIDAASVVVNELAKRTTEKATKLAGGIRPTQVQKLKEHVERELGVDLDNLQSKTIGQLLEQKGLDPKMKKLLELRVEASKASIKKLVSMTKVAGKGGRARGTLLYYGAHTGRDTGKLIQPQNFIRGMPDVADQIRLMSLVFRMLEMGCDADVFEMVFDAPLTAIAQCMRGFIAAKPGKKLLVVDYAQIEARLLVWLAQQKDAVEEYREYDKVSKWAKDKAEEYRKRTGRGYDRYVLMASFLFSIDASEVDKEQRRIAKNLVLGCGFQLGWRKFIEYCAKQDLIIDAQMSKRAVTAFREKHHAVVQYWDDVERCAIAAVKHRGKRVYLRNVSFYYGKDSKFLTIRLPSGRDLYYPFPEVREVPNPYRKGQFKDQLSYMTEYFHQWVRHSTYGGKLVENIVQAIARDIMGVGTRNAEAAGYPVILRVHDEILAEVDADDEDKNIHELETVVADCDEWIGDCPVASEGFETIRYRKG